ncbi:Protein Spindly-B [Chionoecetes opilio]|uniref:Protein Spindly-B n=1 Tax=Chionoecetes opilio TaxID=41210 RepID=A0A8J5CK22_CHIOP|nr:Protein Spindly-B [Chionoecetes opilio]
MEQQVMELRQQLAEAEHNTVLAATFGKQLLEKNQLLEAKQEALEQDKHCLALKLEASVRMEQSLVQEVEALREQQGHQVEAMEAQAAHTHDQNLQRHSRKVGEEGRHS